VLLTVGANGEHKINMGRAPIVGGRTIEKFAAWSGAGAAGCRAARLKELAAQLVGKALTQLMGVRLNQSRASPGLIKTLDGLTALEAARARLGRRDKPND
jgi:hypothetical protein